VLVVANLVVAAAGSPVVALVAPMRDGRAVVMGDT
jgi:hypothetical protein